jgi:hypothetical protein
MVTRVSDMGPRAVAVQNTQVLRCEHCDVTWRGPIAAPCWCCGAPGDRRGDVRVVAD